jgi:hypothetical protein
MRKYTLLVLLGTALIIFGGRLAFATFNHHDEHKVKICHCSQIHCETLEVDEHGAQNHLKQHDNDYAGACHRGPTNTPTQSPTATPTDTLTPTPSIEVTPTATPEASITPTQTPAPKSEDHPLVNDTTTISHPSCDTRIPNKPEFITVDVGTPHDGSLRLLWPKIIGATTVNIFYGEYGHGDQHGIANWPDDGNKQIDDLKDTNYMFCVQGVNGCAVGPRLCIDPRP